MCIGESPCQRHELLLQNLVVYMQEDGLLVGSSAVSLPYSACLARERSNASLCSYIAASRMKTDVVPCRIDVDKTKFGR